MVKRSVVLPVCNERETIEELLERVQAVAIDNEIIVVDDGSMDSTRELLTGLQSPGPGAVRVLLQERNCGKRAALRRGFEAARGVADVVYGSCFLGGPHRVLFLWPNPARGPLRLRGRGHRQGGPRRMACAACGARSATRSSDVVGAQFSRGGRPTPVTQNVGPLPAV